MLHLGGGDKRKGRRKRRREEGFFQEEDKSANRGMEVIMASPMKKERYIVFESEGRGM